MLALIAACGRDGVIGINNTLPWHLPADLKNFKSLTLGCAVIMGRKTYDSIGRALPGRRNIVVSRSCRQHEGCETVTSLQAALQLTAAADTTVFIIGGGEIYRQAIGEAQRLYITEVDIAMPEGDVFFPSICASQWREVAREAHPQTAAAPSYAFVQYERRL